MKAVYILLFCLFVVAVMAGKQADLYKSTIVNYWGNMSSGSVVDSTKHRNLTIINGTLGYSVAGKYGNAFEMDTNDRIKTASAYSRLKFNATKWALCFWMRRMSNTTGEFITSNDSATVHGRTEVWYNNGGTFPLLWYHYLNAASANVWQFQNSRDVGGWAHYCYNVYGNGTDSVELYVNGVSKALVYTPTSGGKNNEYNMSEWAFGAYAGTNALSVRIQHITFFKHNLNASHIDYLYANGTPGVNNVWPYGYSSLVYPAVTIAYPNATRHYNDANYNGSIRITTDVSANCTINDTVHWYMAKNTSTMFRWRNTTNLASRNWTISYACKNTGWTNGTFWFIVDKTKPTITQYAPANLSYIKANFLLNVTFLDDYLYWTNTTIKQANGTVKYNKYSGNLNTTHVSSYSVNKQINITGWPDGNYTIKQEARDTHTLQEWEMPLIQSKRQLSLTAQKGIVTELKGEGIVVPTLSNSVSYELEGSVFEMQLPAAIDVEAYKAVDRFRFQYSGETGEQSFKIVADSLDYLENSPWPCHFIVNRLYWFDCAGLPSPQVQRIDANSYLITYEQDNESITTDSLGGLNYASKNYNFTLDTTAPTVVAHKAWVTSSSFIFNFNTSEVTNYTAGIGSSDCLVHDISNTSTLGLFLDHTLTASGLHYNKTYYINVTLFDQAGNRAKRCFLVNTSNASVAINSVRLVVNGEYFAAYANGSQSTAQNISYECRLYANTTLLVNFTYPTPQYMTNPASTYYQEQADSYYQDTPNPWTDITRIFDNDYSTYAQTSAIYQSSTAIITYYKPDGYTNVPIKWQVKDGAPGSDQKVNLTLPSQCQPDALNYVTVRVYNRRQDADPLHDQTHWQCCTTGTCGTTYTLRIGGGYGVAYEEAFFWTANSTLLHSIGEGIERNVYNYTPDHPGTYYLACRVTDGFVNSTWRNTTGLTIPAFNVTILDENTLAQITGENFSVDLINAAANWSNTYQTAGGFLNFSSLPTLGTYTLRFYSDNYYMRAASLDLQAVLVQNLHVYAIPNNVSSALDVYVRDPNYLGIENATVHLLRFYANLTSWIEVSQEQTNPGGKVRFYVLPANAYYKFVVTYSNETIFESQGEKILATTYIISTSIEPIYETYESVDAVIQIINTTNPPYFKLAYANKKAKIYQVCMDTYRSTDAGLTLFNSTCLTTDSGIIIHPFNGNYTYTAYGYTTYYHSPDIYFAQATYSSITEFFKDVLDMKDLGIVLSILIFVSLTIGTLFITGSPVVLIVALDVALLAIRFLHLFNISDVALGIIIPGSLVVAYYLNKVTY